eukprot:m.188629 g.188629  ORF g.188629 m.188629 type:complete len:109 (+) comp39392_c0_seq1:510-836(+)
MTSLEFTAVSPYTISDVDSPSTAHSTRILLLHYCYTIPWPSPSANKTARKTIAAEMIPILCITLFAGQPRSENELKKTTLSWLRLEVQPMPPDSQNTKEALIKVKEQN